MESQEEKGAVLHACGRVQVSPFWSSVLSFMGGFKWPESPRLLLLGTEARCHSFQSMKYWTCDLCSPYFNAIERTSDSNPQNVERKTDWKFSMWDDAWNIKWQKWGCDGTVGQSSFLCLQCCNSELLHGLKHLMVHLLIYNCVLVPSLSFNFLKI